MTLTATDVCVMTHRQDPDRPRQALDGLYLCQGHRNELESLVAEMPARYGDLGRILSAGSRRGGQRVSGTPGSRVPINPAIADQRAQINAVMVSWCALVRDERGTDGPDRSGIEHACTWLLQHIEWCAGHRWVDEMLGELRQLAGKSWAVIDPDGSKRITIGPCISTTDEGPCDGTLYATVRADDDPKPSIIYCGTCEFEKLSHEWLKFSRLYDRRKLSA